MKEEELKIKADAQAMARILYQAGGQDMQILFGTPFTDNDYQATVRAAFALEIAKLRGIRDMDFL